MAIELLNCPLCNSVMVERTNKKTGSKFYGCSAWPRTKCKGFLPYKYDKKVIEKVAPPTNVVGSVEQVNIWKEIQIGTRHLIVEAVAGSGKTFTIVHALTFFTSALKIAFAAFNAHIADELAARTPEGVETFTLHRYGWKQVRNAFPGIKLDKHKLDTIIERLIPVDKNDKEGEGKNIFLRAAIKRLVQLAKYNLIDGKDQNALETLVEYHGIELNDSANHIFTLVPTVLNMCKRDTKTADFDDMIWFVYAHAIPVELYNVFIGDEIQDWNKMQQFLMLQAIRNNGRFIGVGDRFQSIYGFAGADIDSIPNLIGILSNTTRGANILPLNYTRRCPKTHVTLAQEFVPHIQALDDAKDGVIEMESCDQAIKSIQAGNMGVCRRNAPLVSVAYKLMREGKKVVVKGRDFADGIINLINKLNAHTIPQLIEKAEMYRDRELEKLVAKGKRAENQIVLLNDKIDTLIALTEDMESIDAVVRKIKVLFDDTDEVAAIILSSVHRAKGLEADKVYIFDYSRLIIPMKQDWAMAQERNLAYVAYTRSKDTLVLVDY